MAYIEFKNVCKTYENIDGDVKALKKINFKLENGQLIVLTGPSFSGKTTCLNVLGGIDKVTSGKIIVNNLDISELKERKLVKYRRENVGFVFEDFSLIQNLTIKENVELSTQVSKDSYDSLLILKKVGLAKKANELPLELSKEEQQRALIACALSKKPKILLLDESTKILDNKSKKQVLKLLQNYAKKEKAVVILATNDEDIFKIANKVITLKNGTIKDIKENKKPTSAGDLKC